MVALVCFSYASIIKNGNNRKKKYHSLSLVLNASIDLSKQIRGHDFHSSIAETYVVVKYHSFFISFASLSLAAAGSIGGGGRLTATSAESHTRAADFIAARTATTSGSAPRNATAPTNAAALAGFE